MCRRGTLPTAAPSSPRCCRGTRKRAALRDADVSTLSFSGIWHWLARLLIASDLRVAAVDCEMYIWKYTSPYACLQPLQERASRWQPRQLRRAAAGARLAALAVARLRAAAAAADAAQAAADQAAAIAAEFVMLAGAAEAYMEAAPAAVASMRLPHTASGWVYYCAGAVTGLAEGLISLRR